MTHYTCHNDSLHMSHITHRITLGLACQAELTKSDGLLPEQSSAAKQFKLHQLLPTAYLPTLSLGLVLSNIKCKQTTGFHRKALTKNISNYDSSAAGDKPSPTSITMPVVQLTHSLPSGRHRMMSLAKRFPLAYWILYGVLGKALPTFLLDIVRRPWQSASHLPIGHSTASLAKRLPLSYWTSYDVLGKALPTC